MTAAQLGELLGVSDRTIYRWHHSGIAVRQASDACDRIRVHPTEIWGNEWTNLIMDGTAA